MNPRKWKVNLNHHIFMLYKSAETCHPVSLPFNGTNILIFVTCGASFNLWVWSVQPLIQYLYPWVRCIYIKLHARMFCALAHTSSIPMGAINFNMQKCSLHSLIPLPFSCLQCIYMQERSIHSRRTSSIPMGAMSELETCFEPMQPNQFCDSWWFYCPVHLLTCLLFPWVQ